MSHLQRFARYDRPVPEPHFIPGYTGHCPDLQDYVGINYPWATHAVMEYRPDVAQRLSDIKCADNGNRTRLYSYEADHNYESRQNGYGQMNGQYMKQDAFDQDMYQKQCMSNIALCVHPANTSKEMCSSYAGHVPQKHEVIGKTQKEVFAECICKFEKQRRKQWKGPDRTRCCCNNCCTAKREKECC